MADRDRNGAQIGETGREGQRRRAYLSFSEPERPHSESNSISYVENPVPNTTEKQLIELQIRRFNIPIPSLLILTNNFLCFSFPWHKGEISIDGPFHPIPPSSIYWVPLRFAPPALSFLRAISTDETFSQRGQRRGWK